MIRSPARPRTPPQLTGWLMALMAMRVRPVNGVMLKMWPCDRLRVADRGLREGILATLMAEDGVHRGEHRRGYWRR